MRKWKACNVVWFLHLDAKMSVILEEQRSEFSTIYLFSDSLKSLYWKRLAASCRDHSNSFDRLCYQKIQNPYYFNKYPLDVKDSSSTLLFFSVSSGKVYRFYFGWADISSAKMSPSFTKQGYHFICSIRFPFKVGKFSDVLLRLLKRT